MGAPRRGPRMRRGGMVSPRRAPGETAVFSIEGACALPPAGRMLDGPPEQAWPRSVRGGRRLSLRAGDGAGSSPEWGGISTWMAYGYTRGPGLLQAAGGDPG